MILRASKVIGMGVYTLRSGAKFAEVSGVLLNPHTLKVDAFWVNPTNQKEDKLLLTIDLREMSVKGLIVDDSEVLTEAADLPKLSDILAVDYQIPGKKVVGETKKYGTASDFGINIKTFEVASIFGKPSLLGLLTSSQFSFQRRQISSIDDNKIKVDDNPVKTKVRKKIEKPHMKERPSYSASQNTRTS